MATTAPRTTIENVRAEIDAIVNERLRLRADRGAQQNTLVQYARH